jgi:hypothetical protein
MRWRPARGINNKNKYNSNMRQQPDPSRKQFAETALIFKAGLARIAVLVVAFVSECHSGNTNCGENLWTLPTPLA